MSTLLQRSHAKAGTCHTRKESECWAPNLLPPALSREVLWRAAAPKHERLAAKLALSGPAPELVPVHQEARCSRLCPVPYLLRHTNILDTPPLMTLYVFVLIFLSMTTSVLQHSFV